MNSINFENQRHLLVDALIANGAIKTDSVKRAFLETPREKFLPLNMQAFAYQDNAQSIGFFQTISQPTTIAIMLELLEIEKGMKVLEVGSGSGYVLALLSKLAGPKGKVIGIEFLKELVAVSKKTLNELKLNNVKVIQGDGSLGYKKESPFDRILISCACPFVPKPLIDQLSEKGILVAPVGDELTQELIVIKKTKTGFIKESPAPGFFGFVPLKGKFGFQDFK